MGRVRRYFDHIEGGPAPERNREEHAHLEGRVRVRLLSEAQDQHIRFIWPTMPYRTRGDAALDYLAIHLKRRLARRLAGLSGFRSFDAQQRSDPYHSTFTIWLVTRGRSDLQRLEHLIDEELRRVQERGLSPREFQRVQLMTERYQRSRSPLDWAQSLADTSGARRAPWTLEDERNRYESVRIDDVRNIANEYLPLDRRVEFRTRRARTETPEGEWSVERAR